MVVTEGIHLFKFWLDIGQEMQLKRFHERRHSPLKNWKFSPMDVAGISRWDDYSAALHTMLERTDTGYAPWTIIRSNDKRRARLAAIRRILLTLPYEGRDLEAIGPEDQSIIGRGAEFLASKTPALHLPANKTHLAGAEFSPKDAAYAPAATGLSGRNRDQDPISRYGQNIGVSAQFRRLHCLGAKHIEAQIGQHDIDHINAQKPYILRA